MHQEGVQLFHPRMHGGNKVAIKNTPWVLLSSPQTRGERRPEGHKRENGPFIPAYTGGTRRWEEVTTALSFHPRIHGGNGLTAALKHTDYLSSPHTRGERNRVWRVCNCQSFIPAYTGGTAAGRPKTYRLPFIPAYTGGTSGEEKTALRAPFHPRIHGGNNRNRL